MTPDEAMELAYAVDQVLDDMGRDGLSVAKLTKAKLRLALEPFLNEDMEQPAMSLEEAQAVVDECEQAR